MKDKHPIHPAEVSLHRLLEQTQEYVSREPVKAFAAACGAGLLLTLLPTRLIAGTASAMAVTLVRPALFTLGLLKAFELTCPKTQTIHTHELRL